MVSIAREILFHDKLRFLITVISLGFAIIMTVYDLGMFFGVTQDSITLIDRAHADLWISKEGENHLVSASVVPKKIVQRARSMNGVVQVCALDYVAGNLKIGNTRQVHIVGIDPECPLIQPWEVIGGTITDLRRKNTIVVDDLALRGANQVRVGDTIELNGYDLHVIAITHNNKWFSFPLVYVNLDTFETLGYESGKVNYVAVQLEPGYRLDLITQRLSTSNSDLSITGVDNFKKNTIAALVSQGVGMIFVVVFIGVMVSMLIITLTMYTATMERLRDFAILKALGATRWKIWWVVLEQAITETAISFVIGLGASLALNKLVERASGIRGQLPVWVIGATFILMMLLALFASIVSIRRAIRVDPVMVFRA